MFGDAEINDLPTTVADHEPRVQELEPSGGDDQEVHRGDTMLVVSKKRFPALALIMVRLSIWEISRDCGEANRNPKREQSPLWKLVLRFGRLYNLLVTFDQEFAFTFQPVLRGWDCYRSPRKGYWFCVGAL